MGKYKITLEQYLNKYEELNIKLPKTEKGHEILKKAFPYKFWINYKSLLNIRWSHLYISKKLDIGDISYFGNQSFGGLTISSKAFYKAFIK